MTMLTRRQRACTRAVPAAAAAALVTAALIAGCGGSGSSLLLYSGQHPLLTGELVKGFERETGIQVAVHINDGLVIADQLLQEGSDSPADVYLTENSPELQNLDEHGLLAPVPESVLSQVPAADNSPQGDWVAFALRISALAYDPARISASQLPTSVLALAGPAWKGRIGIAPSDSDFPPVVSAVKARYGLVATKAWLAGLERNATIYQDDESVVAAVNRGEIATGIINSYYWFRLRFEIGAKQMHSAVYYFPNHNAGSVENISGAAILKAAPHRTEAERFLRYIVSAPAQSLISHSDDFEYPVRPGVAPNPELPRLSRVSPAVLGPAALGNDQAAVQLIQAAGLV